MEIADIYEGMYELDKYSRIRLEKSVDLALKYIPFPDAVLDVGCYKQYIRAFLPLRTNYIGIDYKKEVEPPIFQNLNSNPYLNSCISYKFDLIFSCEILEHLLYPHIVLEEYNKILCPKGKLIISLPNENTLFHRVMMILGKGCDAQAFKSYKHLHLPTIKQQREFLSQYMDIIEETPYISSYVDKSRGGKFFKWVKYVPDKFWYFLANINPSLFARGMIYIGNKK